MEKTFSIFRETMVPDTLEEIMYVLGAKSKTFFNEAQYDMIESFKFKKWLRKPGKNIFKLLFVVNFINFEILEEFWKIDCPTNFFWDSR